MTGTLKRTTLTLTVVCGIGVLLILLTGTPLLAGTGAADEAPLFLGGGCEPPADPPPLDLDAPPATTLDDGTLGNRCMANDFLCGGCPRFTVCAATAPYQNPVNPSVICCGNTFECVTSCRKDCSLACAQL